MDLINHSHQDELQEKDSTRKNRSRKKLKTPTPSLLLKGKVLSISTCDQDSADEEKEIQPSHSYKAINHLCRDLGAVVSSQVHTRVFAVICTPNAVKKCTQRVRKVLQKQKSQVGLIHVQWLHDCLKENKCIDWKPYSLNELGQEALLLYEENRKRTCIHINHEQVGEKDEIKKLDNKRKRMAMAEEVTIALDCCCVCHDTDRDDCPYCSDCNVTQAKKRKTR